MSKEMTKNKLVQALNTVGSKLDTNMTGNFMGEFGCADIFGTKYKGFDSEDFLTNLKKLGVDVEGISYSEPFWYLGEVQDTHTEEVVEDSVTPLVEEQPEEDLPEVEETTKDSPDWEWISTLNNNKDDKAELDVYAEKFNVKLNQRNSLKNMISDFKDQLSS